MNLEAAQTNMLPPGLLGLLRRAGMEIFVDDQKLIERAVRVPVDGNRHEVVVRPGESSI
jgi:hypothetical protein